MKKLGVYVDDEKSRQEYMNIKYKNKVRLANYILEHNGIVVDPRSIFDVQVKRLHEYKRQLMNILHVMYLYNKIKDNPDMPFYPHTFIFGAKAAAGYHRAKLTAKSRLSSSRITVSRAQRLSLRRQMSPSRFRPQVRRRPAPRT